MVSMIYFNVQYVISYTHIACLEGYFKSFQGNASCKKCPDNSTSTISGATNCTCNPGYELSNNGLCDGKYDIFQCSVCYILCTACLEGRFKSFQGNASCKVCPDNSTSTISGATNCTCNPGYELSNNGLCDGKYDIFQCSVCYILCTACLEGRFKSFQGNASCKECPENSNSTTSGATNCTCITGYYRSRYENVTVACTGKYQHCVYYLHT